MIRGNHQVANGHLKRRNVALAGNDKKMTALRNFKLKFSGTSLDLV